MKRKKTVIKAYDIDNAGFCIFYVRPAETLLHEVSDHCLQVKYYKKKSNKDYTPLEKTAHTRKKRFIYDFNGIV
jgi:hypothetical protein